MVGVAYRSTEGYNVVPHSLKRSSSSPPPQQFVVQRL